jgi:parallel beta-helix repeat protein
MEHVQSKLAWILLTIVTLVLVAALAGVVRGGPLDPPAAVGPTGKNVITSLPFTISQPGSYVLNGNLTLNGPGNGIDVSASNVTIDLQGFELVGTGSSIGGIRGTGSNLTVRNGTVRNWPGVGVGSNQAGTSGLVVDSLVLKANGIGIQNSSASLARVTNCQVEGSIGPFPSLMLGARSIVENCVVTGGANVGISVGDDSVVTDSVARSNGGTEIKGTLNLVLENCVADGGGTGGHGIDAGHDVVIRSCTGMNNVGDEILAGNNAVIEDCVADGNATPGVGINAGLNAKIKGCTAGNSQGIEISAGDRSVVESCTADGSGLGGDGIVVGANSIISGCTAKNSLGNEITAGTGSTLENCTADGNGTPGVGIFLSSDSVVRGCAARNNGATEILGGTGTVLEACVADGSSPGGTPTPGYGIDVGNASNVRGCSAKNNGDAEIRAGNGSVVEDCVADGSHAFGSTRGAGDGIVVLDSSIVRNCTAKHHVGAGIAVIGVGSRVEGNTVSNNATGIDADIGSSNIILMNFMTLNDTEHTTTVLNQFVVITSTSGATNPFANVTQ